MGTAGLWLARPAAANIIAVEPFRTEEGHLVFQVRFEAPPDPARVRLLLDVNGPVTGEMSTGADYMIEGGVFYRYPARAQGWTWEPVESAAFLLEQNQLIFFVPPLPLRDEVAWGVEILTPGWELADRFPETGMGSSAVQDLARFSWKTPLQPENLEELVRYLPVALSRTFEDSVKAINWEPVPEARLNETPTSLRIGKVQIPLRVRLLDAKSGNEVVLQPDEVAVFSNRVRWTGTALGLAWVILVDRPSDEEMQVTGQLKAGEARCVRMEVGLQLNLDGGIWHDDIHFRRALTASSRVYSSVVRVPFGLRGVQSTAPMGVISTSVGNLGAETDPGEPRVFEIFAEPGRSLFGIRYDLALTAQTSNFPGCAFFRCAFRVVPGKPEKAYRTAWAGFYQRYPAFFIRRMPACGFGRPFDPVGWPRTVDFACDVEGLLQPEETRGVRLLFLEPWSFWSASPTRKKTEPDDLLRRLRIMTAGTGASGEQASAVLLGGARGPEGNLIWTSVAEPWHTGLYARVNTDPRLATTPELPVNGAMVAWRRIREAEQGIQGIYLDTGRDEPALDFNPAAIQLTDHPCTFAGKRCQPGLAIMLDAVPAAVALARAARAGGGYVAASPSPLQLAFLAPELDMLIGSFDSGLARFCEPDLEQAANGLRVLAGTRPVVACRSDATRRLNPAEMQHYLEWCLFRAFLPTFFSRGTGADRLWVDTQTNPEMTELLRTYLPLIRRLADAGWRPVGTTRVEPESLWSETFGSTRRLFGQVTLRNTSDERIRGHLILPDAKEPLVVLDPLTGDCQVQVPAEEPGANPRIPVTLMPYQVVLRDWFALSELHREREFLEAWLPVLSASACLANLNSLQNEWAFGAPGRVSLPMPAVHGDRNEVVLEVANRGASNLGVSDLKVISSRVYRPLDGVSADLPPGGTTVLVGHFETEDLLDDPWLEIQWELARGDERRVATRRLKPRIADPLVFVEVPKRAEMKGPRGYLELPVRNYSNRRRPVQVKWQGDFKGGRLEQGLEPDRRVCLRLPIECGRARSGEVFVEITMENKVIYQKWFEVIFR